MPANATLPDLQRILDQAAGYDPAATRITISPGLAGWMLDHRTSLAFTSYQTGQLILAGVDPQGRVAFDEQNYARATGLCFAEGALHVGSLFQLWRLENMLQPGQYANGAHDAVFVPRAAATVNYVDTHEIDVDADGRVLFVNTRYSCIATADARWSFRPLWKPAFVSELVAEDRCHLNGFALVDGRPAFATAAGISDRKGEWRASRTGGGVLIDIARDAIVTDRLSMPHSPRWHDGAIWLLDSGRGQLVRIDPASGAITPVASCPGFLRGLAFHGGHAVVTVSRTRESSARDLTQQTDFERSGTPSQCGVLIIELASGRIVESILFDGRITEMFAVAVLPGIRNPISLGPQTVDMIGTVAFDPAWTPHRW
ncbi:TIGR03032 family protein [Sphingomonas sp. VNH70]|uniref:TIGR03032 family protein n=1 Tax=Sphingomonas silueang TaxID=3156617 RepID=UPI0032B4CF7D